MTQYGIRREAPWCIAPPSRVSVGAGGAVGAAVEGKAMIVRAEITKLSTTVA